MKLFELFSKYNEYPDFIGIQITDVNQKSVVDDTMLHIAARNNYLDDVICLIKHGASVNIQGDLGYTALQYACMCGHVEMVRLLLKYYNADKNIRNEFGQNAMDVNKNASHHNKKAIAGLLCGHPYWW